MAALLARCDNRRAGQVQDHAATTSRSEGRRMFTGLQPFTQRAHNGPSWLACRPKIRELRRRLSSIRICQFPISPYLANRPVCQISISAQALCYPSRTGSTIIAAISHLSKCGAQFACGVILHDRQDHLALPHHSKTRRRRHGRRLSRRRHESRLPDRFFIPDFFALYEGKSCGDCAMGRRKVVIADIGCRPRDSPSVEGYSPAPSPPNLGNQAMSQAHAGSWIMLHLLQPGTSCSLNAPTRKQF
jgi:hypothetical protein